MVVFPSLTYIQKVQVKNRSYPSGRMNNKHAVKDRILVLMRDRLLQLGFSKVTLDEIATELGISKKTLYKYFVGKDDLALQAIRFHFLGIECEMNEIVSQNAPFTEKLHNVMMMQRRQIGKLNSLAIADIQKHAPDLWKEMETLRRERLLSKIEVMFREAHNANVFRPDIDIKIVMKMIFSSVDAIANPEMAATLSKTMGEVVHSIFDVIFSGALTDESRALIPCADTARTETSNVS